MRRILLNSVLLTSLLIGCRSTLERAPGPEASQLADAVSGTLLVPPVGGGWAYRTIHLVDLPSLRERSVDLDHDPVAIAGLDAENRFVYAFDADAGVTLNDHARRVLELEPHRSLPFERWRLRCVDVATETESDFGAVEDFPHVFALAPTGGRLVAAHDPAPVSTGQRELSSEVWFIDVTQRRDQRVLTHQVGRVLRCDWKPDGSAFALTGSAGGELFDAASLTSSGLQPQGFGPFSPDGSAYLTQRDDGYALVQLADHEVLVADALLPWPYTRGTASERGDAEPIGLCGDRLALYEALPTEGRRIEWSIARGGYLCFEHAAVKVVDLETGRYATVLAGNKSPWTPRFIAVRLDLSTADFTRSIATRTRTAGEPR